MYYSVDRIEGDFAVLQDEHGSIRDVNLKDLPENIKESDILKFDGNIYIIDEERTVQVKENSEKRFKKLFII